MIVFKKVSGNDLNLTISLVRPCQAMVYSEKTLIWLHIKKCLSHLNQAGINPIEFLIWTQVSGQAQYKFK